MKQFLRVGLKGTIWCYAGSWDLGCVAKSSSETDDSRCTINGLSHTRLEVEKKKLYHLFLTNLKTAQKLSSFKTVSKVNQNIRSKCIQPSLKVHSMNHQTLETQITNNPLMILRALSECVNEWSYVHSNAIIMNPNWANYAIPTYLTKEKQLQNTCETYSL